MSLDPVDIVVFAPHPDDEVIGTGGVIQQALAAGRRVRVVFSTSGDGYPRAAAALAGKPLQSIMAEDFSRLGRQRRVEAVAADTELGLRESDIVHLGFPDGAFEAVLAATGAEPARARLTGLTESPTTGVLYTHRAALKAFGEVIDASQPGEIYVTDAADEHPDHRATQRIVVEAMREVGSEARLYTFVVHAARDTWPDLGPRYETKLVDGVVYPRGIEWPPPIRLPVTPEEVEVKRRALKMHASQWALDHAYLDCFVKSEEVFWPA